MGLAQLCSIVGECCWYSRRVSIITSSLSFSPERRSFRLCAATESRRSAVMHLRDVFAVPSEGIVCFGRGVTLFPNTSRRCIILLRLSDSAVFLSSEKREGHGDWLPESLGAGSDEVVLGSYLGEVSQCSRDPGGLRLISDEFSS